MKNVLLVFGGRSYEHDISVVTAAQIFNRTKLEDIKLIPLYISRQNKMFVYLSDKFELKEFSRKNFSDSKRNFKEVAFVSGEMKTLFAKSRIGLKEYLRADVAIFATHGGDGENGKLQAIFNSVGIACSAYNEMALSICMNKFIFKQVMKGLKIRQVTGFRITHEEYVKLDDKLQNKLKKMRFPVIIKSVSGGSSIGVFVAENLDEFHEKIKDAFEFDSEVLIEKFLPSCREFNVAVIGTPQKHEVSEVDEPLKLHELLSFEDKYNGVSGGKLSLGAKLSNGSKQICDTSNKCCACKTEGTEAKGMAGQERRFPADISEMLREKIRETAARIFSSLGLFGVVRIDFLFDEKSDKLYVCEVNTIPGSLAFYFFKENKITTNSLVLRLIEIAEEANLKNREFNEDFSTNLLG